MVLIGNKEYNAIEMDGIKQVLIMGMASLPCKSIDCHTGISDCQTCQYLKVCRDMTQLIKILAGIENNGKSNDFLIVATNNYDITNPLDLHSGDSITININKK